MVGQFHLDGFPAGQQFSVGKIEIASTKRLGLLATGIVLDGGWVDLADPVIVRGAVRNENENDKPCPANLASTVVSLAVGHSSDFKLSGRSCGRLGISPSIMGMGPNSALARTAQAMGANQNLAAQRTAWDLYWNGHKSLYIKILRI